MEWADAEVNREGSKLFGWPAAKVETALRNHQKGRTNAKPITRWSLTVKDFAGWFINGVLKFMIGTLHLHGVLWIGKSRVGKSNGSKTLAWTHSAYSIQKKGSADDIAFLTVKHMDFFKGEPTTDVLPGIFDDGLLQKVRWSRVAPALTARSFLGGVRFLSSGRPRSKRTLATLSHLEIAVVVVGPARDRLKVTADVLKAFLNPKEEDALLWARWGGCGFEQGSCRQAVANPYDRDAERAALDAATLNKYDLDHFKKIVAPSLEEVKSEEDFNAVLARSHVVVVTDLGVHWRVASADLEDGAEFMPWPNPRAPDLFASEVRDTSSPAVRPLPSDYADKMEWSIGYMRSLVEGRDVPTVATVRIASMFGDGPGRTVSVVGSISGFVEPGAAASASSAPAAASASRLSGAAVAPEEDVFGFGGGMDELEESAPAASAAQPDIVGRCGELTKDDQDEQIAIFKSLARAHHGAFEDLCSPPPVKRAKGLMMGCGGPLSEVDAAEQAAIFASIVASASGETIAVDDDDDNDGSLEADLGRMIEEGDQASGSAAAPRVDTD